MQREINSYGKKKNIVNEDDEDVDDDLLPDDNEDFSNGSSDDQAENSFLKDLGGHGLNHDRSGDDFDDCDINWDKDFVWKNDINVEGFDEWYDRLEELKDCDIECSS